MQSHSEGRNRVTPRRTILAPTRYPWRFNGPANSRHCIENRDFLPLNYLSPTIEGVTVFKPWPPRRFDLVHAFNRIPIGRCPFVIGFESHLPRAFGIEGGGWWDWMTGLLASERCRGIVAISEFSRRMFLAQHARATRSAAVRAAHHRQAPPALTRTLPCRRNRI